ncbi:unnamed protein product [Adineta steineri]|uniref:Tubulin delta chain n=1 Tax=Adineta steineri TaxID=433720 RepID=A0A815LN65_9BILA|nr:unnamed protein product [Adineta steineri]
MSCIVLQLGQCGNQVGQRLFDTLIEDNLTHPNQTKLTVTNRSSIDDYIRDSLDKFFIQHENKLTARALVIDTELKVIEQLMDEKAQSKRHWHYEKKCVIEGRLGSGNNWACGYRNGSIAEEKILNSLRWQLEKADRVDTILPILSLAGGTGSGLGAYAVEIVRDELPRSFLLTTIIVPYTSGEVVVQNYNSLLTLSHLYHSADALLVFENDILQQYAKKLVSHSGLDRSTNIHDMNNILTRHLCSILQPISTYTSGEVVVQNYNSLLTLSHLYHSADALLVFENDILQQYAKKLVSHSGLDRSTNIHDMNNILTRHLCSILQPISTKTKSTYDINNLLEQLLPHPFYKLLTLRCVPQLSDQALDFSTYKWSSLIKTLSQMYINNSYLDEGLNWSLKPFQTRTKSLANIFLSRSYDKEDIENDLKQYFNHSSFYSSSISSTDYYHSFNYRNKSYLNYEKYLSFISNCQTPVSSLDRIVNKSWQLYGQKAYLHHYMKYDIDEQTFLNSFVQIEQVIKSYNQFGEVVVQNYNSLLTLSHLYHSADALLVFENDILQQYAKKLVSHSGLDRSTNIHDMNNILTRHLCSILQPISTKTKSTYDINNLLEQLLPHPFYKLLTLRCVPQLSDQALDFSTYKWSSLIKNLSQMYINNSYLDEGLNWSLKTFQTRTKSLANIFLSRSYDKEDIENDLKQYFNHSSFYSSSISSTDYYHSFNYRNKSYLNYEKYLSFISNCQTPVSSLDRIVNKSWQLYGQKAYLHHYMKYDIDEQTFLNSFVQIEQVIKSYNQL